MAKKPTAAMLNNRGIPVEELNKIISSNSEKQQRIVRNGKRKKAMERRPGTALLQQRSEISNEPAYTPNSYLYDVPDWFNLTVKPQVSVIIPMFKSTEVVRDQIATWVAEDELDVEIVYVDDQCPNDSKAAVLDAWTERNLLKPVGKIVVCEENCGYARACNVGASHASGDYLIFLNSDTKVTSGWIKPMVDLFVADERVGMVGNLQLKDGGPTHGTVDSAGSGWNWQTGYFEHIGRHLYHGSHMVNAFHYDSMPDDLKVVSEREMVTGCCFMMTKKLFDAIDGFDPRYRIGYWEDSDLCMRVREEGYKILFQPKSVIWHKLSHSGAAGHSFYRNNSEIFRNRWVNSGRFDKLLFTPRPSGSPNVKSILVKRLGANGDVLMATAVLPALRKKWPRVNITFWTNCEQVLAGNPHIDRIVNTDPKLMFDLIVNLDLAYEYHPKWSIVKSYANEAGVPVEDCKAFVATKPSRWQLPNSYVVMHAKREVGFGWAGRNWKGDRFSEIAKRFRDEGKSVVLVGGTGDWQLPCDLDLRGKTNTQELATIMLGAKFFVGIDSMPMHIAQIMGTPGVVFFGSILPQLRLTGNKLHPVNATNLDCIGCHHEGRAPSIGTSECKRGDFACEQDVTVDMMWQKIKEVMSGKRVYLPVV